jgi:hypothetical protein
MAVVGTVVVPVVVPVAVSMVVSSLFINKQKKTTYNSCS